jgi:hypothetical protein
MSLGDADQAVGRVEGQGGAGLAEAVQSAGARVAPWADPRIGQILGQTLGEPRGQVRVDGAVGEEVGELVDENPASHGQGQLGMENRQSLTSMSLKSLCEH